MRRPRTFKGDRIGEMLLDAGIITKAALEAALALHEKEGRKRYLGDYLLDMGVCTAEDLAHVLKVQNHMRDPDGSDLTKETTKQSAELEELGDLAGDVAKRIGS